MSNTCQILSHYFPRWNWLGMWMWMWMWYEIKWSYILSLFLFIFNIGPNSLFVSQPHDSWVMTTLSIIFGLIVRSKSIIGWSRALVIREGKLWSCTKKLWYGWFSLRGPNPSQIKNTLPDLFSLGAQSLH